MTTETQDQGSIDNTEVSDVLEKAWEAKLYAFNKLGYQDRVAIVNHLIACRKAGVMIKVSRIAAHYSTNSTLRLHIAMVADIVGAPRSKWKKPRHERTPFVPPPKVERDPVPSSPVLGCFVVDAHTLGVVQS